MTTKTVIIERNLVIVEHVEVEIPEFIDENNDGIYDNEDFNKNGLYPI